ncbi:MAG: hypothetical protein U5M51_02430 [Emticicia sp.]|nr:hypothetical protein [Emticicia sp.]
MEIEDNIENIDGIIRLHRAKPEELGKLSTEIDKELIEYESYY